MIFPNNPLNRKGKIKKSKNKKDIFPAVLECTQGRYVKLPGPLNLEDFKMFRNAYRLITPDEKRSLDGFLEFIAFQKDPYPDYTKSKS